jgi:hypothetical protein
VAIALVHHPVLDGQGAVVTTAVTNLDVHDLARSARTYGCSDYFVVHPVAAQRELVERIREHWTEGSSARRIPDRREALRVLRVVDSLEAAVEALGGRGNVEMWATAARRLGEPLAFSAARDRLSARESEPGAAKPVLIVFGTGWGLAPSVVDGADALLEPIRARAEPGEAAEPAEAGQAGEAGGYNHLSVRAACAIALDRLLGER